MINQRLLSVEPLLTVLATFDIRPTSDQFITLSVHICVQYDAYEAA